MNNGSPVARLPDPAARKLSDSELSLVLAAERLFAERGVAAVSLRQIVAAAGHKNMSAAHYHFGSREGLLRAVIELRMPHVDGRRRELMDRLPAAIEECDMRSYVEIYVLPLADQLRRRSEGNYYLRFLEQYRFFPSFNILPDVAPATYELADRMRSLLSYLPPAIADARFDNTRNIAVSVLAYIEQKMMEGHLDDAHAHLLASDLVDEMTAALAAPLSARTIHLHGKADIIKPHG